MNDEILNKKDSVIIIYDIIDGDDYFSVDIKKNYGDYIGGNFHDKFIEFQPELDSLEIKDLGDEYVYYGSKTNKQLKKELEDRGFKTITEG
jgi:hypothetical protein